MQENTFSHSSVPQLFIERYLIYLTHLIVMVLAEAHAVLEQRQQGKVVLQGLSEGNRHPWLTRIAVGVDSAEVQAVSQALDEVVFGQPHPLVCPHTVVTQVLLAVDTVGCGWVLLITRAALRFPEVVGVQQASMGEMEAGGTPSQTSPVVMAILVLDLLRAHHHVQ